MNIGEATDVQRILTALVVTGVVLVDRDNILAAARLADRSRKTLGAGMDGTELRAQLRAASQARQS